MTATDLKLAIGKRVHNFRIENDYTQAQFAEIMDISVNFLSEIENGKKGMSQDTLYRLCLYFHISADYILFGNSTETNTTTSQKLVDIASNLTSEELDCVIAYLASLKKMKDLQL